MGRLFAIHRRNGLGLGAVARIDCGNRDNADCDTRGNEAGGKRKAGLRRHERVSIDVRILRRNGCSSSRGERGGSSKSCKLFDFISPNRF